MNKDFIGNKLVLVYIFVYNERNPISGVAIDCSFLFVNKFVKGIKSSYLMEIQNDFDFWNTELVSAISLTFLLKKITWYSTYVYDS